MMIMNMKMNMNKKKIQMIEHKQVENKKNHPDLEIKPLLNYLLFCYIIIFICINKLPIDMIYY